MTLAKKVILKDSEGNYLVPFVDTTEIENRLDAKAEDESVVKKTGDTMSGRLVIASDIKDVLRLTNTTKTAGVDLASEVEDVVRIDFYDATSRVGDCGVINNTSTITGDYFRLRVLNHTTQKWVGIYLYNLDDGTSFATCPTPTSATDSSTKIATTAWVQNHLKTARKYTKKYIELGSGTTDLSSSLPNDGKPYLVLINAFVGWDEITAGSDIVSSFSFTRADNDAGRSNRSIGTIWLPVGAGRKITVTGGDWRHMQGYIPL